MTIYIDVVILENLIMNYIILLANGIILKKKIKHVRLIFAGLIGAIYSVLSYFTFFRIYGNLLLKFLLSIIIVYIAYNPQDVKELCKDVLVFYLTSFVFGGAAFALIYIVKPQDILMKNGLFLGTYPLKTVILAAILAFIVIILTFKIIKIKISKKDMFCKIELQIEGISVQTTAMVDTGNLLQEPITGIPVIVIEHTLLYKCIPREILNNLEKILGGDLEIIPKEIKDKYISKLKFIPFSSLGKQNGMLVGIKPDFMKINDGKEIRNVIIGIYNKSLTKRGEYRALIGIDLL